MHIQALFAGLEPGSAARVDDVRDALDDTEVLEYLASVLTLSEMEPIALLILYQGGERNRELAQRIMHVWAQSDSDAQAEHSERLALWGIHFTVDGFAVIYEGAS